jgi:hypothetical protein
MNYLELTDFELEVNSKMADIHRQALKKKLKRVDSNDMERANTIAEIEATSSIGRKSRLLDDANLRSVG